MPDSPPASVRRAVFMSALTAGSMFPFAVAQEATPPLGPKREETARLEKFFVTGSMIKRLEGEGALPLQTITPQQMEEAGIVSAEQLVMALNINGNGLDNLASNAD